MLLFRASLVATCAILLSCGALNSSDSSSDTPSVPPKSTEPAFSLVGIGGTSWTADCLAYDEGRSSKRFRLLLEDYTYRLVEDLFDGPNCAENLKRITYTEFHENVRKNSSVKLEGWLTFASQFEKITALIHQEAHATRYNNAKNFDITDWKVGESRDISGRRLNDKAEPKFETGDGYERTFKIDGDILYIARYVKGVPEARTDRPYKKMP